MRTYMGFDQCRLCGSFLDSQLEHGETCSTAEATRGHYACVHAVLGGLRLADPGINTEPRGLVETQSRPADLTAAAVPEDAARLWTCVCGILQRSSSPRRCSARPASSRHRQSSLSLDSRRSTTPSRHRIVPHRTVNVSKSPLAKMETRDSNGPPPTKSSHDTGRPHTSAREHWLLAGLIDRAASHWIRPPPLDGGDDDEDADAGTDTTIPDSRQ